MMPALLSGTEFRPSLSRHGRLICSAIAWLGALTLHLPRPESSGSPARGLQQSSLVVNVSVWGGRFHRWSSLTRPAVFDVPNAGHQLYARSLSEVRLHRRLPVHPDHGGA